MQQVKALSLTIYGENRSVSLGTTDHGLRLYADPELTDDITREHLMELAGLVAAAKRLWGPFERFSMQMNTYHSQQQVSGCCEAPFYVVANADPRQAQGFVCKDCGVVCDRTVIKGPK